MERGYAIPGKKGIITYNAAYHRYKPEGQGTNTTATLETWHGITNVPKPAGL
jgi:hypothetical protein